MHLGETHVVEDSAIGFPLALGNRREVGNDDRVHIGERMAPEACVVSTLELLRVEANFRAANIMLAETTPASCDERRGDLAEPWQSKPRTDCCKKTEANVQGIRSDLRPGATRRKPGHVDGIMYI